jgi:uncharacterized protein YndB with AHSA1/START domain
MSDTVAAFPIPPVVKTVTVRCAPATAFRVFTAEIGQWWPLADFSMGAATDCRFESHVGGRLYQVNRSGQEKLWGHVLAWDPPHAMAFSWQVQCSPEEAQRIDVSFRPVAGGTEVKLVHAGWDKLKTGGAARRESYDGGWVAVFEQRFKVYADKAEPSVGESA